MDDHRFARRARRALTIASACALLVACLGAPAHGAEQTVTAVVRPVVGVEVGAASDTAVGTSPATVQRRWQGDTLVVTVVPRG